MTWTEDRRSACPSHGIQHSDARNDCQELFRRHVRPRYREEWIEIWGISRSAYIQVVFSASTSMGVSPAREGGGAWIGEPASASLSRDPCALAVPPGPLVCQARTHRESIIEIFFSVSYHHGCNGTKGSTDVHLLLSKNNPTACQSLFTQIASSGQSLRASTGHLRHDLLALVYL